MDERVAVNPPVIVPGAGHSGFPRSILLVSLAIFALVVVALFVAIALPGGPTDYAAGTPEATFQEYFAAWESRDLETAYAHLSSDVRSQLTLAEYRRMDAEMSWSRDQDRRVVLVGATVTGERAVLDVRIDQFSGGGLGGERYSLDQSIPLLREDGAWVIDQALLGTEVVGYPGKY